MSLAERCRSVNNALQSSPRMGASERGRPVETMSEDTQESGDDRRSAGGDGNVVKP